MKIGIKGLSKESITAYLFLLPNFLGFLVFTFFPVIISLILSFFEWDILTPPKFVGLSNFIKLLGFSFQNGLIHSSDPRFWQYLYNTLFLMLGIPIGIAVSLVVAIALNQRLKGIAGFRTLFFLPTACHGVAIALLWKGLYNPDFGFINTLIAKVGQLFNIPLFGPNWLVSITWAKPAIMLMMLWVTLGGYNTVLYLAALQGIPRVFYEAADIDGANAWQKFWTVTWPMISPTTFFIAIMSVIGGFQGGFMAAYIMTGGGPAGSTTTLEFYIFNNLYVFQHVGYAAAISWVLFLMIFGVTLINWKYGGRVVRYDTV